jgi:hypothetical protein
MWLEVVGELCDEYISSVACFLRVLVCVPMSLLPCTGEEGERRTEEGLSEAGADGHLLFTWHLAIREEFTRAFFRTKHK